jgi:membrane protein YqaA with SNARE-associated domain
MGWLAAAGIWGFGEATLFFIIPDVILTAIAIRSLRQSLVASCYALAGALIGGTLMYYWGAHSPEQAASVVEQVPLIDQAMVEQVRADLRSDGILAIAVGPIKGVPYKIYATSAEQAGISYPVFIIVSIFARMARFVATSMLAWGISRYALPAVSLKTKYLMLAGAWASIYLVYTVAHM